ncbi:pfs domain-containing protein [Colletotrichum plurivorum]|uniref:Pfs domain-containing protein n=1 Tax=Colletotrichum plurivorum TaxID=2175906 RepID=A0A8H6NB09_9PEZI|nr:pfs domain-containing protein [Colletotrichum plurivorum]
MEAESIQRRSPESAPVHAKWDLAKALLPLFHDERSLPTTENADHRRYEYLADDGDDEGRYGYISGHVEQFKHNIKTLGSDLAISDLQLKRTDIDQLAIDDPSLEVIGGYLEALLEELEQLVDSHVAGVGHGKVEDPHLESFPKLDALRQHQRRVSPNGSVSEELIRFVNFPRDARRFESCKRSAVQFYVALKSLDPSTKFLKAEPQVTQYTPRDVAALKHAHGFASTCTSLFSQMVKGNMCATPHRVKLHLSGFKEEQLEMSIETCGKMDWISAIFTRSIRQPSMRPFFFHHICSPAPSPPPPSDMLHVAFNSEGIRASSDGGGLGSTTPHGGEKSLEQILGEKNGLPLKYRKLAIALLAACMFQLGDSPWIGQHLAPESIFVPVPLPQTDIGTQHWCPRIVRNLVSDIKARPGLQSDNIAAFGVLMLELETQSKADWEDGDEDYDKGEMSNNFRLARVLKSRKDDVDDDCNKIANACLQFDKLVDILVHPDIDHNSKGLAVIYKYILEPLFRHVSTRFGILTPILDGMFTAGHSLTAPTKFSSSVTARRELFDDDESTARPGDIDGISQRTTALFYQHTQPVTARVTIGSPLAKSSTEKVRIAVLNSGVDGDDAMIKSAIKFRRTDINKSRSFVVDSRPIDWQVDCHGHGTHVTRLLLQTAPAAEICVAKICTGKVIYNEFMPGIAQAINWAFKECEADIISMSFGFEEADEAIEMAVEDATQAGKLVTAAASNNDGRSGRARPARRDDVICIHATDGNGNKGGMNPSPVPETDNFATLGVAVPSRWNNEDVWKLCGMMRHIQWDQWTMRVTWCPSQRALPQMYLPSPGPPSTTIPFRHHPSQSSPHNRTINFGSGSAEGLKKQQPTYFVAPNFTTRPFPDGPLDLGTLVEDLEGCYPINQGSSPSSRVPIPEGQRYADTKEDVRAAVKASAGAEASVLAKVLDRSVGGDASLRGERSDEDVYTFRTLETVYFYPTPGYIKQCLQLRDVKDYSDMADYQAPLYLITGLKIARGATISTDRSREYEGSAQAGVQVPTGAPVDVSVAASARVSGASGVVSSFGEPADFVLAVQAQKIYYKRRFLFGEPTLATKRVVKNAVLVDDEDVPVEDDGETDFDYADLESEEVENLIRLEV